MLRRLAAAGVVDFDVEPERVPAMLVTVPQGMVKPDVPDRDPLASAAVMTVSLVVVSLIDLRVHR